MDEDQTHHSFILHRGPHSPAEGRHQQRLSRHRCKPFPSLCEAGIHGEGSHGADEPTVPNSEAKPPPPAVKATRGRDVVACVHLFTRHVLLGDFTLAEQEHTKND